MKKGKFKWRWERSLQSGQSKFAPIGWKVSWGEEDRLEEGLLVPAKEKNKREGL
jgi:hypothetical protein